MFEFRLFSSTHGTPPDFTGLKAAYLLALVILLTCNLRSTAKVLNLCRLCILRPVAYFIVRWLLFVLDDSRISIIFNNLFQPFFLSFLNLLIISILPSMHIFYAMVVLVLVVYLSVPKVTDQPPRQTQTGLMMQRGSRSWCVIAIHNTPTEIFFGEHIRPHIPSSHME